MRLRILAALGAAAALAACGSSSAHPAPAPPSGPTGQHGVAFGTPGPWPVANVTYGGADGIRESPVVGISTDEAQDRWVATPDALYLLRPADQAYRR